MKNVGTEFPRYFEHSTTQEEFNQWMEVFYQYHVYYINHEIAAFIPLTM